MKEVGMGVCEEYLPLWMPTQTLTIFLLGIPVILQTAIGKNKEVNSTLNRATQ